MVSPLADSLSLSISLIEVARASGLTTTQARRFLAELVRLPDMRGDALLAEARREQIREASAEVRRRSRR